jgi:hypothetical protein
MDSILGNDLDDPLVLIPFYNDGDADEGQGGHNEEVEEDGLPWWQDRFDSGCEDEYVPVGLEGGEDNPTHAQLKWLAVWRDIQGAKFQYPECKEYMYLEIMFIRIALVAQPIQTVFYTKTSYKKSLEYELKLVNKLSDNAMAEGFLEIENISNYQDEMSL